MYNLIRFILKYHFTILFIILEIIALILVFQYNNYQKSKAFNAANFITGTVYETQHTISSYFKLKKINDELSEEIARLKSKDTTISYIEIPVLKNDTIFYVDSLLIDTNYHQPYLVAKVISNNITHQLNTIFINKGEKDGFYKDMGVINKDGVVGVVRDASNQYAVITPIINEKFNVSAKLKSTGHFGNLTWDGKNPNFAYLADIPNHISPQKGDTIITSGYSQVFEEGHTIGYIEEIVTIPGKSFIDLKVKLAVEFSNLNYVYGVPYPITLENDTISIEI